MVLFAEEQLVEELAARQEKLTVKTHQRKPRQPGIRAEMLANPPTEVIRYEAESQNGCPVCQGESAQWKDTFVKAGVPKPVLQGQWEPKVESDVISFSCSTLTDRVYFFHNHIFPFIK